MKISPRFLFASALAALFSVSAASAADAGLKLGLQSWTCRNMEFDEVVAFAKKHGLRYLQMFGKHIDPKGSKEEALRKKAVLEENGLELYTIGVCGTTMDKEENRKLFEFAKLMGLKLLVVEPGNMAEWDNLEELVKEYDVKLAIHNHGTGTVYGDPATVKKVLAERDARIGVCLDVGWITAAGFDAAEVFRGYEGRVFDMHFKDKRVETSDGKPVAIDVEAGTGRANYDGLFAEIKKAKWNGVLAIETDNANFAKDPNQLVKVAKALFAEKTHE